MHILLLAATPSETALLRQESGWFATGTGWRQQRGSHHISLYHSGIGMSNTAYALGKLFATASFDLAIQFGIGGSFDRQLPLGEVVEVSEDIFVEMGAESPEGWLSLENMEFPLLEANGKTYYQQLHNPQPLSSFQAVRGITVNTVSGVAETIAQRQQRWAPVTESMEGAAFFLACLQNGLPFAQIRAISNYVEPRNRANWDIPTAVKNAGLAASELIEKLIH
ncbi:MAG: futalosine hydrolase [Bacteroidota bacterium]